MRKKLLKILNDWPKIYISSTDLTPILNGSSDSLHALLKRAVQESVLIRLKRDFYLIVSKVQQETPDVFELAALIYGPSYISFESALSFHGWIPESVPVTTCACVKRSKIIETPIGVFSYDNVSVSIFNFGIDAKETNETNYFIAAPWKAIADLIFIKKKNWVSIIALSKDMRVEIETMQNSDMGLLKELSECYPNSRVRKVLHKIAKDLQL